MESPTSPSSFRNQPVGFWGRVFSSPTLWMGVIILGIGLPLAKNLLRPQVKAPPIYGRLPDVAFVDQNSAAVKLSDFRGRVLLINFIFTRCPGTCPLLSAQMAKVQRRIVGSGPAVKLLSITVDPDYDSPAVLKEYAEKFGAKHATWSFVRAPLGEIERVLVDNFKLAATNPHEVKSLMDLTHSEQFVIVDQLGQIRGYRTLNNNQEIDAAMKDIAIVANTNPEIATPRSTDNPPTLAR